MSKRLTIQLTAREKSRLLDFLKGTIAVGKVKTLKKGSTQERILRLSIAFYDDFGSTTSTELVGDRVLYRLLQEFLLVWKKNLDAVEQEYNRRPENHKSFRDKAPRRKQDYLDKVKVSKTLVNEIHIKLREAL